MRKSFDEWILDIVDIVGSRGTCDRGRSGCVIVRDKQIISIGYVGAPSGSDHCDDVGHEMENGSCIRSTHAEQNALINSAKNGVSTNGATLYCTMYPCYSCAKMIINAGVKKVVAKYDYHKSDKSKRIFFLAGIDVVLINDKIKKYE